MYRFLKITLTLAAFLVLMPRSYAATFTVQSTATPGTCAGDPTQCTLQDALTLAQGNGVANTINIEPGIYQDVCSSTPYSYVPTHNHPLTIQNAQADLPVLDACVSDQVMNMDTTGLGSDSSADITITGLVFQNGNANSIPRPKGGGLKITTTAAQVSISQSSFLQNFASNEGGGAIITTDSGAVSFNQCLFSGNQISNVGDLGAGLLVQTTSANITLQNNTFEGNFIVAPSLFGFLGPSGGGGAALLTDTGNVNVTQQNKFSGNSSGDQSGGGLYVAHFSSAAVSNLTVSGANIFSFNQAGGTGGGVAASLNGNIVFQGNTVEDNNSIGFGGGGLALSSSANLTLDANLIQRNTSSPSIGFGGGGILFQGSNAAVTNNVIIDNFSRSAGGGLFGGGNQVFMTNNTFFNNTSLAVGGGIVIKLTGSTQTTDIYNNIIFGNSSGSGLDIFAILTSGGTLNIFNNDFDTSALACVPDCSSVATGSNLNNVDPQFVNSANGDFNLLSTSPVIEQGNLNPPGGLPTPDFAGNPRPSGPLPDMGALEFQITPPISPTPPPIPSSGNCSMATGPTSSWMLLFLLAPMWFAVQRFSKRY